jgi:hypothetical protein
LSNKRSDSTGTEPCSYVKTRVARCIELLNEALDEDADYQGDMCAEAHRQALMTLCKNVLVDVAKYDR